MRRILGLVWLGFVGGAAAQTTPPPTAPTVAPLNAQVVFDEGARLLKTFYYGFSGANLDAQIASYRDKLNLACQSPYLNNPSCPLDTGEQLLKELYRSVNDRHLYILNAAEFQNRVARYEAQPQKTSTYGLTLGQSGARGTVVQDVLTGSPAEGAGIVPGDLLALPSNRSLSRSDLEAPTLTLLVRHGTQQRPVTLSRAEVLPVALPSLYAPADAPAGVLVLRIPSFAYTERVGPKVHELVHQAQARGATGLIVDLRRGPGGSNYECEMAAAAFTGPFDYLVQTPRGDFPGGWLGNISTDVAERAFFDVSAPITQQHLAYELPNPALWQGKAVVLVDARSASCHEYMAYFMQQNGIPVIGEPTLGLMNTASLLMPLPGGGAAALVAVRSAHPDGTVFPERLTPDETLSTDWAAVANGQPDALLIRAYELLK